jgi:hypothetical protein
MTQAIFPSPSNVEILIPKTNVPAATQNLAITIPTTTDEYLKLIGLFKTNQGGISNPEMRINNDAGANYFQISREQVNSAPNFSSGGTGTNPQLVPIVGTSVNAANFTRLIVEMFSPKSAQYKHVRYEVSTLDTTGAQGISYLVDYLWLNTAAITSININLAAGNYDVISWYELFGYKKQ